ncbi:MAG: hypothetical protein JXB88_23350 [Spirochaetales bacterium]|nr:hypothetical protein [Spirochaetales bacterium]
MKKYYLLQTYNTTVTLKVSNTGNVDVQDTIPLRFNHITPSGTVETRELEISSLPINQSAILTLTPFDASIGDTLSVDRTGVKKRERA